MAISIAHICRVLICLVAGVPSIAAADVIYVNVNGNGGNGTSWANAHNNLDQALGNAGTGDEIWLAAGWHPVAGGQLVMSTDIAIYGGFAGNEADLDDRDWETNISSVPRVHFPPGSSARLDGITIAGGTTRITIENANPWVANCMIADATTTAVIIDGGSPTFVACRFECNAGDVGSAMNARNASQLSLIGCSFTDNTALACCSVFILDSGFLVDGCDFERNYGESFSALGVTGFGGGRVINCVFSQNDGNFNGGPVVDGIGIEFVNCVFSRNQTTGPVNGALMAAADSSVINCTFSQNTGYGVASDSGGVPVLRNCIAWDNGIGSIEGAADVAYSCIEGGAPGVGNIDADPLFVQAGVDDVRLSVGSPCLNVGDNVSVPLDVLTDLDGFARIQDCIVDMGAYEGGHEPAPPAEDAEDVDPFEAVFLSPVGQFDPLENPAVLFVNVGEQEDGYVIATQHDDVADDDHGLVELGHVLHVDSTLAAGDIRNTVYIPFTVEDLVGTDPLEIDLAILDPETNTWHLAVESNVQDSPGHAGPVGDRIIETGDGPPGYSAHVGDYGVFWNPVLGAGVVWANTDTLGHYAIGADLCFADFGSDDGPGHPDGVVDVFDMQTLLASFGTANLTHDLDGDGVVGILDLLLLLGSWGTCR